MNGCPDCPSLLARAERAKAQAKKLNEDWHQAVKERDHNKRMWDGQIKRTALAEARVKELEAMHSEQACAGESLRDTLNRLRKSADAAQAERDSLRTELAKRDEAGRKLAAVSEMLVRKVEQQGARSVETYAHAKAALAAAPSEWKEKA